jgi:DNA-directed RNA polymerase specialized sigma24 family protein
MNIAIAAMHRYCVEGDARAFATLFSVAAPQVRASIQAKLRDTEVANEVLQRTFLELHRRRRSYIAGADPVPWLHAIAQQLCAEEQRRERREQRILARSSSAYLATSALLPEGALRPATHNGAGSAGVAARLIMNAGAIVSRVHRVFRRVRVALFGRLGKAA